MKKRNYSATGYEGIILRGIARSKVFWDDYDLLAFKERMFDEAEKMNIAIIGYALSENCVRLLIKCEERAAVSVFIKMLCISYVRNYFNPSHDRSGSLFQSRFKNEEVEPQMLGEYSAMMIFFARKAAKKKKNGVVTSYEETVSAYKSGADDRLDTHALREQMSLENFIVSTERDTFPYLPRLAYTPNRRETAEYLREFSVKVVRNGNAAIIAEQMRLLIQSLKRNNVPKGRLYKAIYNSFKELIRYAV